MTVKEQILEVAFCAHSRDVALIRVGNLLAELGNPDLSVDKVVQLIDSVFKGEAV